MRLFVNVFTAIATFTTFLYFRRRRTWLMALLITTPVFVPFLAIFNPSESSDYPQEVFDAVAQFLYLLTITPLMALVFGCSLLSEEIEGRTLPLLLARAAPRSAIVLGKYVAFVFVTYIMILVSFTLTFSSFAHFLALSVSNYLPLFTRANRVWRTLRRDQHAHETSCGRLRALYIRMGETCSGPSRLRGFSNTTEIHYSAIAGGLVQSS